MRQTPPQPPARPTTASVAAYFAAVATFYNVPGLWRDDRPKIIFPADLTTANRGA